ncbi:MAG: dephospho-CoA kinase, partial [Clostridia bacterium]|nr:dephospho-CoA kinase [Clostridia bacterium]
AGIPVVDTDGLAREVVEPGHPCLTKLTAAFSPAILREDGTLNRPALAAAAFATAEGRARLNAITHPHILRRAEEILADFWAGGVTIAAVDAPLLFESGMDRMCHRTVAVLAPAEKRQARIMARDGLTEEAANVRMNAQPAEIYYIERADEVLRNERSLEDFRKTVAAFIDRLKDEWYETN